MVINVSIYTITVNCSDTWALDVDVYSQKIMFRKWRKWKWFFTLSKGSIRTAKFIIWKKKKYELNDQDESLTTNDWLPPVKEIFRIIIVTVGIILEAENIKEYSLGTALVFRAQASFINSQRYWVDWYEKMVKLERRLYKVFISFVFCQNLYL